MKLHSIYNVTAAGGKTLDILPFSVELEGNIEVSIIKRRNGLELIIDRKIDPDKLKLVKNDRYYKELPDGTHEPVPMLEIMDDEHPEYVVSQDIISALIFLTDTPATLSVPPHHDSFLPETDKDRKILKDFGTDQPLSSASSQVSVRSFSSSIETDTLVKLMPRRAGIRLYSNAVRANLAVAQFRELWRVLESAFGKTDDELVGLITKYPPAKELKFDEPEVRKLLILRGRASHAHSSSGIKELAFVDSECSKQLPRLKNLCERVILTKKSWGYPTLGADELLPLAGFIGPANVITVFRSRDTQE